MVQAPEMAAARGAKAAVAAAERGDGGPEAGPEAGRRQLRRRAARSGGCFVR